MFVTKFHMRLACLVLVIPGSFIYSADREEWRGKNWEDKCFGNKVEILLALTFQRITFQQKKTLTITPNFGYETCLDVSLLIITKKVFMYQPISSCKRCCKIFLLREMCLVIANIIMHSVVAVEERSCC